MLNRRQLIKASAATTLFVPMRVFSTAEPEVGMLPSANVIYDVRFPESQVFAEEATRLGASVRGIRGDITELWYEIMSPGSGALQPFAGLTQESDFFLLHQTCIARGCRLAYLGEHTYHTGVAPWIEHRLRVSAQLTDAVKTLAKSGENWPRAVVDIVSRADPDQHEDVTLVFDAPLVRPTQSPGHLVSWIIMPV